MFTACKITKIFFMADGLNKVFCRMLEKYDHGLACDRDTGRRLMCARGGTQRGGKARCVRLGVSKSYRPHPYPVSFADFFDERSVLKKRLLSRLGIAQTSLALLILRRAKRQADYPPFRRLPVAFHCSKSSSLMGGECHPADVMRLRPSGHRAATYSGHRAATNSGHRAATPLPSS